ncbi:LysR family transcriptional regulator [Massilioclostridium coli]|uniref:LysR family transcriptional regulator n=1 Tax=Massilioclostridium coli TaxID=1870991 RepID=UPI0022DF38D6|nr:LysR family transcriptional regulator [Massilioclostridium coli]
MELRQLYYFNCVAESQCISKTAKALHIAQPSLTQTIKRLEREIGAPLFDHVGRQIVLNTYGKILYDRTRTIFASLNQAKSEILYQTNQKKRTITLSVHCASPILPGLVQSFKMKYPDILLRVYQSSDLEHDKKDVDLKISAYTSIENLSPESSTLLLEENLVIAKPFNYIPNDPAKFDTSVLSLKNFCNESFISLTEKSSLYEILQSCCQQYGFTPNISLFCDNPQVFREMLKLGMGVSLIPERSWAEIIKTLPDLLTIIPIHSPASKRYIYLTWEKEKYQSEAVLAMKQHIIDYFSKLV